MYEHFEHTADLGLRVRAPDLNTLFAEAATGLFAAVVAGLDAVRPTERVDVAVDGTELDYLLFDWLRELLFRFDADHLILSRFEVAVTGSGLKATCRGEPLDPARHVLSHEVKAITYHGLRVERDDGGWVAEVIVDI
jgi:SHS2 domain-containing protein